MNKQIKAFVSDDRGATSIEYGLIATFIGLMLIVAVPKLRNSIQGLYNSLASGINNTSFTP